jgi:hypothetical protein
MTIEIIKKANEYRERATRYLKNFEWDLDEDEFGLSAEEILQLINLTSRIK